MEFVSVMIDLSELKPQAYYWARRKGDDAWEVVQVSTVFGGERDFWTIARIGSDLHGMLDEFEYQAEIEPVTG